MHNPTQYTFIVVYESFWICMSFPPEKVNKTLFTRKCEKMGDNLGIIHSYSCYFDIVFVYIISYTV